MTATTAVSTGLDLGNWLPAATPPPPTADSGLIETFLSLLAEMEPSGLTPIPDDREADSEAPKEPVKAEAPGTDPGENLAFVFPAVWMQLAPPATPAVEAAPAQPTSSDTLESARRAADAPPITDLPRPQTPEADPQDPNEISLNEGSLVEWNALLPAPLEAKVPGTPQRPPMQAAQAATPEPVPVNHGGAGTDRWERRISDSRGMEFPKGSTGLPAPELSFAVKVTPKSDTGGPEKPPPVQPKPSLWLPQPVAMDEAAHAAEAGQPVQAARRPSMLDAPETAPPAPIGAEPVVAATPVVLTGDAPPEPLAADSPLPRNLSVSSPKAQRKSAPPVAKAESPASLTARLDPVPLRAAPAGRVELRQPGGAASRPMVEQASAPGETTVPGKERITPAPDERQEPAAAKPESRTEQKVEPDVEAGEARPVPSLWRQPATDAELPTAAKPPQASATLAPSPRIEESTPKSMETAAKPEAPAPPADPAPAGETHLQATREIRSEISIELPARDQGPVREERVSLRMMQKGEEVHVSVRASDRGLSQELRTNLTQLADRLDQAGLRGETWRPFDAIPAAERPLQPGESQSPQSSDRQDSRQGRDWGGRRQQQQQQQQRPQWVEELEKEVHTERSYQP